MSAATTAVVLAGIGWLLGGPVAGGVVAIVVGAVAMVLYLCPAPGASLLSRLVTPSSRGGDSGPPVEPFGVLVLAGNLGRLVVFHDLVRRYPRARRLFVGGAGPTVFGKPHLGVAAKQRMRELGIDPIAVEFESESRNTHENATLSAERMGDDRCRRWLLVTDDWHVHRAVGCFRKAGWNVSPAPLVNESADSASKRWQRRRLARFAKEAFAIAAYKLLRYM